MTQGYHSAVYGVLNCLLRKNIVEVQNVRPKIYGLRQTNEAVDRLVRDKKVQMDTEMRKLEEAVSAARQKST